MYVCARATSYFTPKKKLRLSFSSFCCNVSLNEDCCLPACTTFLLSFVFFAFVGLALLCLFRFSLLPSYSSVPISRSFSLVDHLLFSGSRPPLSLSFSRFFFTSKWLLLLFFFFEHFSISSVFRPLSESVSRLSCMSVRVRVYANPVDADCLPSRSLPTTTTTTTSRVTRIRN